MNLLKSIYSAKEMNGMLHNHVFALGPFQKWRLELGPHLIFLGVFKCICTMHAPTSASYIFFYTWKRLCGHIKSAPCAKTMTYFINALWRSQLSIVIYHIPVVKVLQNFSVRNAIYLRSWAFFASSIKDNVRNASRAAWVQEMNLHI